MRKTDLGFGLGLVGLGALLLSATPAHADMKIQKAAKAAGFEVKNCMDCHKEKMPKKDAVTYNAKGQFLLDKKAEMKAEEVDVNWLKDYVEKESADKE